MPEQRLTFVKYSKTEIYVRPDGHNEGVVYNLYKCSCGNLYEARQRCVESKAQSSTWACGCLKLENVKRINDQRKNVHGKYNKSKPSPTKGRKAIMVNGKRKYLKLEDYLIYLRT